MLIIRLDKEWLETVGRVSSKKKKKNIVRKHVLHFFFFIWFAVFIKWVSACTMCTYIYIYMLIAYNMIILYSQTTAAVCAKWKCYSRVRIYIIIIIIVIAQYSEEQVVRPEELNYITIIIIKFIFSSSSTRLYNWKYKINRWSTMSFFLLSRVFFMLKIKPVRNHIHNNIIYLRYEQKNTAFDGKISNYCNVWWFSLIVISVLTLHPAYFQLICNFFPGICWFVEFIATACELNTNCKFDFMFYIDHRSKSSWENREELKSRS